MKTYIIKTDKPELIDKLPKGIKVEGELLGTQAQLIIRYYDKDSKRNDKQNTNPRRQKSKNNT